jgi:DNA repair protein SbcC/Rad50
MKILELRFKNLNSLYGEWHIDFTDPEYLSHGIFAITGPTGAGKSTILDALCLALYGTTPRLGKITAAGNEIMSRQTGECYAEVVFRAQSGTYRSRWSQHRSRKKADGKLADTRHEIAEAETGLILAEKKRETAEAVEEKTGMTYDRFTRSILLAQGGFDTFLKADAGDRAPILEQITGTEIYSDISILVHERKKTEQELLERLKQEIAGIALLSDQEAAALTESTERMRAKQQELAARRDALQQAIRQLEVIDQLEEELKSLREQESQAIAADVQFAPNRERLEQASRAAELDGDYAALTALRSRQEEELSALKKLISELPENKQTLQQLHDERSKAETAVGEAAERQKTEAGLIRRVRALDLHLTEKREQLTAAGRRLETLDDEMEKLGRKQAGLSARREAADRQAEELERYLQEHAADAVLAASFSGLEGQIKGLETAGDELQELSVRETTEKERAAAAEKRYEKQAGALQKAEADCQTALQQQEKLELLVKENLAGKMLREYRTELNSLQREQLLLRTIASLEDERQKLEDGKPCPLCGSPDHPYAAGNIPKPDEVDLQITDLQKRIDRADELQLQLDRAGMQLKKQETARVEAEKRLSQAAFERTEVQTVLKNLQTDREKGISGINALKVALKKELNPLDDGEMVSFLDKLKPDGKQEPLRELLGKLLGKLSEKKSAWQEKKDLLAQLSRTYADIDSEQSKITGHLAALKQSFAELQQTVTGLYEAVAVLNRERDAVYGDKDPDAEELRLEVALEAARETDKAAREAWEGQKRKVDGLQERIGELKKATGDRIDLLTEREAEFLLAAGELGFPDEAAYSAARLAIEERRQLQKQADGLSSARKEAEARRRDREQRLRQEREKERLLVPSGESQETLTTELTANQEQLQNLGEEIGAARQKLIDHQAARDLAAEKQTAVAAQMLECRKWDRLHLLIGSADGKKYRNFAQGLTFELMISHANLQLRSMTDRYLLVRDADNPLELNVVDDYQAGEVRSTRNLSGGESFIVSLALALGLSHMASRKVRVDSLFLDEGFGTLDEESLETALETLAGLHQQEKLIGVISHVPALKERIPVQIAVLPGPGGRSILSGPGCTRNSGIAATVSE